MYVSKVFLDRPLGMQFSRDLVVESAEPQGQCGLGGIFQGCVVKAVGGGGAGAKVAGTK